MNPGTDQSLMNLFALQQLLRANEYTRFRFDLIGTLLFLPWLKQMPPFILDYHILFKLSISPQPGLVTIAALSSGFDIVLIYSNPFAGRLQRQPFCAGFGHYIWLNPAGFPRKLAAR
jgi:hypothetical protein